MKIYEILNQQPGQNDEDDEQGKFDADKVDQNLQTMSNQVNNQQVQPDPQGGQPPNPPELDDQNSKPIDSALMSQLKSLPYAKKYKFADNDEMNAIKLAEKPIEELTSDLNTVNYKMQMLNMKLQVGADDNKDMEFANDLKHLLNTILHFKKTNTKSQLAAFNPSPPYQGT